MPNIWDLLGPDFWPTRPYGPPVDPGQGSGWSPSPMLPWEAAAATPGYLAPDATAPSGPSGAPDAPQGLLSPVYGGYRNPGPSDEEKSRQDLAYAQRANAFAQWFFGPGTAPQQGRTAAPIFGQISTAPQASHQVVSPVVSAPYSNGGAEAAVISGRSAWPTADRTDETSPTGLASLPVAPLQQDPSVQKSDFSGPGNNANEMCSLMPGSDAFRFCLYFCPSGDVRRSHGFGSLGRPRRLMKHNLLGVDE
jgi:hypothetical protein